MAVEARSLASLNFLAANPPQYPVNPTEEKQDPLTLYISRVPGTRDVILSTSKPQVKNVTSHDVANSLYYIHLELPGEAPTRSIDTPRSSIESGRSANQIKRKPLPAGAQIAPARDQSPANRSPVRDSGVAVADFQAKQQRATDEIDTRRWTGDGRTYYSVEDPSGARDDVREAPSPVEGRHPLDRNLPPLPERPAPRPRERTRSRSPSPIKYHNTTATPYTLHIIRRDPNTGHQWNIGRVSSSQLETSLDESYSYTSYDPAGLSTQDQRRKANTPQPDINITLETSGYAKFRGMPSRQSPDAIGRTSASPPRADDREPGFKRLVFMTYTKSWTAGIREKLSAMNDKDAQQQQQPRHTRTKSTVSATSATSTNSVDSDSAPITRPGLGLRPKGYMFESPWGGLCQFRTGNGGRSVKLRHALSGRSGGYNPLVPGTASEQIEAAAAMIMGAADVSELRFNLPGRELFHQGKEEAMARKQEIAGHLGRLMRGTGADEDTDALALGREKAGGGNRGKRAKLGKLIVSGEGMKMLDLVVAANIGVWWGAWEKTF
ncbi:hypothetical protein HYQ44_005705 [Verticillium longisporum]|nr:hypothetical protein HYQ44_005705 [Verticillium longisporum]